MPDQQSPHRDAIIVHFQVAYLIQHFPENPRDDIRIIVHHRKPLSGFIFHIFDIRKVNIHQTPYLPERIN